jgi:hypothetical protein
MLTQSRVARVLRLADVVRSGWPALSLLWRHVGSRPQDCAFHGASGIRFRVTAAPAAAPLALLWVFCCCLSCFCCWACAPQLKVAFVLTL